MAWTQTDIPNLQGRTALVTGANGGLGLETAMALAARGAHVIMTARSSEKGAAAEADLRRRVPGASVETRALDLASLASIRECAEGLRRDRPALHILVNNAGVMGIPRQETADGFEMQFGVNHLGHFALTGLLFPALVAGRARIVTVSSSARFFGQPVDPADPHLTRNYDPWRSYGQSKLANLHFALELQERADRAAVPIASLAADPGFSATDLQAHSARTAGGRSQRFFHRAVNMFGTTPRQGALPQIRAATDPDAPGGSIYGLRWLVYGGPVRIPTGRRLRNPAARRVLWEISEGETGITFDVAGGAGA